MGLPSDESLKMLAEYFGVGVGELLPDKSNEEILVEKNKTIARQKNAIIGISFGCALSLFVSVYVFVEPLRATIGMLGLGIVFILLGIFNMCGNIGSIHWYNRRKVTKENQKAYCLVMGLGTLIIGVTLIAATIVQVLVGVEQGAFVILGGVVIGFALMLYAQFKYNKGLF